MPFVNIQILKGHPQERKDEIARRVMAAISELARFAAGGHLGRIRRCRRGRLVCRRRRVSTILKKQAGQDMNASARRTRMSRSAIRDSARSSATLSRSRGSPPASCSPKGRYGTRLTSICCSATCPATICANGMRRRRHHLPQALRAVERPDLGRPGPADRLRACDQQGHAHRARRDAARSSPAITRARS